MNRQLILSAGVLIASIFAFATEDFGKKILRRGKKFVLTHAQYSLRPTTEVHKTQSSH